MDTWWNRYPGLLEAEYQRLGEIGAEFSERQDEKAEGRLVLDIRYKVDEAQLTLEARFPDTYPYARPEVYARDLDLPHHQNPFEKNLCVIGRRSENWTPQMSLADLLRDQLPKVLKSNQVDRVEAVDLEEHQGEPITAFFEFDPGSVAFIDGGWVRPEGDVTGRAGIALIRSGNSVRAAVVSLISSAGVDFSQPKLPVYFPGQPVHPARWVHLDRPILEKDPAAYDRELARRIPALKTRHYSQGFDLVLVGFPEEHTYRNLGQGWILLVRERQYSKSSIKADRARLVRVHRVGRSDFAARLPISATLRTKRVAIFGLGCVGAPIALELARAGVGYLFLVDHDVVEGASTVRWPMGLPASGEFKVRVIKEFIDAHYPHATVEGASHRVGAVSDAPSPLRDSILLPRIFEGSDLIVDATAELGIQRLLSDYALQQNRPYVAAHATNGGLGGQVVRLANGRTGCLNCLRWHQHEGRIDEPPFLDEEWAQPDGCASPTFTGAAWDLQEVSLEAVRLVVATLKEHLLEWDVAVLAQPDLGRPPNWKTFVVPPHPNCEPCLAQ